MKPQLFVIVMSCLGCASESTPVPTLGESARQYFDAKVYPILAAKCASCHMETVTVPTLGFIASDPSHAYDTVTASDVVADYSIDAPIVTIRPTHKFDYSPQELSTILEWLRLEREQL